jgi:iron complex transport system substrate-binding protein
MIRKLHLLALALLLMSVGSAFGAPAAETRVFTDMAGREVHVPRHIHRVLAMSPVGTILTYTIDPSLLVGWNVALVPQERELILPQYRDLPLVGGWYGKDNTGNLEKIIAAHPDIMITMGDPQGLAQAERVQAQTHLPVVVLNGDFEKLPEAYLKAGELLDRQSRAKVLAEECRRTLHEISAKVAGIPMSNRRRYYYAEGPKGMETEPTISRHVVAMSFAGGINVAAGVENQQGYGHSPVSMEQILRWNPEIIITGYDHNSQPGEFYSHVWNDALWQHIRAVQHHEVFETPQYPFCWIDRPPSANLILGVRWLAYLFYPDRFAYNMRDEARHFYKTFYWIDVDDRQLDKIMMYAERRSQENKK